VSTTVAANMLATAVLVSYLTGTVIQSARRPIETNRMLSVQFHLRIRGAQKIEPPWEKVSPERKTHKFFITE